MYKSVHTQAQEYNSIKMSTKSKEFLASLIQCIDPCTLILQNDNSHNGKKGTLYMGGLDEILCENTIAKYDHIISIISKEQLDLFKYEFMHDMPNLQHDLYEYEDSYSATISDIFNKVTDDIHDSITKNKSVYVHCFMGRSRSATIIVAYMMKYHGLTFDDALDFINAKRRVCINLSFIRQLRTFAERLRPNMTYNQQT